MPGPIRVLTLSLLNYGFAPDGAPRWFTSDQFEITLISYIIGISIGIPLGITMAWYPKFDLFARPCLTCCVRFPASPGSPL